MIWGEADRPPGRRARTCSAGDEDVLCELTRRGSRVGTPGSGCPGADATLEDLGSKNGTFVGDGASPITGPTVLPDDSRFRLGRVLLVFRSSPEAGSTMTEHRG